MNPEPPSKNIAVSKTALVNAIISVLVCFAPGPAAWVAAHPTESVVLINLANIVLRKITKERVHLWKRSDDDTGGFGRPATTLLVALLIPCLALGACVHREDKPLVDGFARLEQIATSARRTEAAVDGQAPAAPSPVAVPHANAVINPAVYRPASDADLAKAFEKLQPAK